MSLVRPFVLPLAWVALTLRGYCWDDSGHLLIAQIAYDRVAPALQQKLSAELSGLSEGAHSYNAISAACFADDLRRDQHHLDASWHFIDPSFMSGGKLLPSSPAKFRACRT